MFETHGASWRFGGPASAVIIALYNLASLSEGSDGTEILKFLVKYALRARGYVSYYYTLFNSLVPWLRMIARFGGDFRPNNVIHGLFFMFSLKW